jgi:hypothetical protein
MSDLKKYIQKRKKDDVDFAKKIWGQCTNLNIIETIINAGVG